MRPVRVLHVVGWMNPGGVETWLMQILRNTDLARIRAEFLVMRPQPGHYDDEIRSLGSTVFPCPKPSQPVRFARRLDKVLRTRGPYDVVHSHVHHFSGLVLAIAAHAGVRIRVAHSHSNTSQLDDGARVTRRLYLGAMKAAIRRCATHGLAASEVAAAALFGPRWREDDRWSVCHCGLDVSPFRTSHDRAAVRRDLGIPPDALVVGHVGRFDHPKNHSFMLRIAADVLRREENAFLVLVGHGRLRDAIESEVRRLRIARRVLFTGARNDVARLLRAFDVFLFPSIREGLPLATIEAQAAGLPIVLSDTITREVELVPELLTWLPLTASPVTWGDAVIAAMRSRSRPSIDALAVLERSDFTIESAMRSLERVYGLTDGAERDACTASGRTAGPFSTRLSSPARAAEKESGLRIANRQRTT